MRRRAPWEIFRQGRLGRGDDLGLRLRPRRLSGLKGGGYDPLVHDQVGIAVWWILLAGVLVGALPRRRFGPLAWAAAGLLAAFVAWTALSLVWTESVDRTWADTARVATYLGVFALALFLRGPRAARLTVGAVGAGIATVAVVGLLSRLHPAWFPEAAQTARFLSDSGERLAYPLNYWNALAALIAIGMPLLLEIATGARSVVLRGLAAATLPALMLTASFTLSRGGIAAAVLSLAIFLALSSDRLPKALALLVAAAGGAILVLAAASRDALRHGVLNTTAESQGDSLLLIAALVCLAVGLVQAALSMGLARGLRPRWTHVSRRRSLVILLVGVLAALILAVAVGAPGRASDAWHEFKRGDVPQGGGRLSSAGGEGRYEFWSVAVEENASDPLTGSGSGTFEYWWNRNGSGGTVRDTHSLYFQTLGELGIVGIALLAAFLALILAGGARAVIRATSDDRSPPAAALAGCLAFFFTAIFDWMWQVPVLVVAVVLLASVLVDFGGADDAWRSTAKGLRLHLRAGVVIAAALAILAIALPLATTSLVRRSEADARTGDLLAAFDAARSAQNVLPGAAAPRLQQALVLESQGRLALAVEAARAATEREATNWRTWLVLSRVEAEGGMADAAIRDYKRAKSLNPHFSLFDR